MKIITNTASSLTQEEGKKLGISIIPVSVSLGGRSLRDYTDITSDEYVKLLHGDEMPVSSTLLSEICCRSWRASTRM